MPDLHPAVASCRTRRTRHHRSLRKDIAPIDLVEESLRRIAADDHNAVIRVEVDSAREAAANHPRTGPLAGLPLLVKDMACCKGSVITMGGSPFLAAATLPEQLRQSLTWDQRAEMAQHAHLRIDTGLPIYFCDPHRP